MEDLTLEQVQKKIEQILVVQKQMADARNMGAKFEEGIGIVRQTATFMFKVAELAESMNLSHDQFQEAVTLLTAIGGPRREVMFPGVLDFYVLLLEEQFLLHPSAKRAPGLFQQKSAIA